MNIYCEEGNENKTNRSTINPITADVIKNIQHVRMMPMEVFNFTLI